MNLKQAGSNQTILDLNNGNEVFFSYNTPVAAFISGRGYLKTDKKWSVTTSKHINKYCGSGATVVPQAELDALIA